MSHTPELAAMPAYQLVRRASILRAARELIEEKDVGLVQMKDVAQRAGVAVGTLYRYFSSKDHLYATVLGEWGRPRPETWYSSLAPADRFRARLHQMFASLARHPEYYGLVRMVASTSDRLAIAEASEIGKQLTDSLVEDLDALPADEASSIAQIVWSLHVDLLGQISQGRIDLTECLKTVDTFVDLVRLRLVVASD